MGTLGQYMMTWLLRPHCPGWKSEMGCRAGITVMASSSQHRHQQVKPVIVYRCQHSQAGTSPGNSAPASTNGDDGRHRLVQVSTDARAM